MVNTLTSSQSPRLWQQPRRWALTQKTSTYRNTPSCRILDILTPCSVWTKGWSSFQSVHRRSVRLPVCLPSVCSSSGRRHTSGWWGWWWWWCERLTLTSSHRFLCLIYIIPPLGWHHAVIMYCRQASRGNIKLYIYVKKNMYFFINI